MKNVKKLLKKAMVWTLAASMLVATPLTASAAGLRGVYSVSDGVTTDGNGSGTGTVSSTYTNTTTLAEYDAKIIGIVIDKEHVDAVAGVKTGLKATIVYDGGVISDEVLTELNKKITWRSSDPSAVSVTATADNRSVVSLNPRKGTKKGSDVTITASIDWKYGNAHYTSEPTTVSVKEYATRLTFADVAPQAETRTVNMKDYLTVESETANDDITWSIATGVKGAATINANTGLVTIKKYSAKDANENPELDKNYVEVTAVSERGVKATTKFAIKAAVKPDKVGIYLDDTTPVDQLDANKPYKAHTLDFGDDKLGTTVDVKAVMFKKDDSKKLVVNYGITDSITWTSNKPDIVAVSAVQTENCEGVTLTAFKAGKATITAKTSSNKKATLNVTVKATLTGLEIDEITQTLYSGQSVQMTVTRTPDENKDALKWAVEKVESKDKEGKMIANPNASINSKGVLTIKNKVDERYPITVSVTSKTKDAEGKYISDTSGEITVEQSSVKMITIKKVGSAEGAEPIAWIDAENSRNKKTNGKEDLSVPKTITFEATTEPEKQDETNLNTTLKWAASGNDKVVKLKDNGDGTADITAVGKGNSTITVSGINVNGTKVKMIKTTFKVVVKQPATKITLKKDSFVIYPKTGKKTAQTVSLSATQYPKNAKEVVTWTIDRKTSVEGSGDYTIDSKKGKVTIDNAKVGEVYEATATTATGVSATATIEVKTPVTGIEIMSDSTNHKPFSEVNAKGKTVAKTKYVYLYSDELSFDMYPEINIGGKKVDDQIWVAADTDDAENGIYTEDVTYSVNKAGIVKIEGDKVYAVAPGVVTITAKTPNNKKATLKVEVKAEDKPAPAPAE